MGDGLDGLRHDAVVGGDDQHDDVGDVGAAGTHRGERLVAGRIDERDRPAVVLDLVGADVLGDAAALGLDDVRLADPVQKRGLAVVDVAQDRDDRGPRLQVFRVAAVGERVEQIIFGGALVDHLELDAELHGQHDGQLVVERALMVASWFMVISLRIRSLALTPIASERPRTVIGGSISTWRLACGATAGAMAAAGFLDAGARAADIVFVGEEGGGRDG